MCYFPARRFRTESERAFITLTCIASFLNSISKRERAAIAVAEAEACSCQVNNSCGPQVTRNMVHFVFCNTVLCCVSCMSAAHVLDCSESFAGHVTSFSKYRQTVEICGKRCFASPRRRCWGVPAGGQRAKSNGGFLRHAQKLRLKRL